MTLGKHAYCSKLYYTTVYCVRCGYVDACAGDYQTDKKSHVVLDRKSETGGFVFEKSGHTTTEPQPPEPSRRRAPECGAKAGGLGGFF
jgi:hypothetical protein